MKVLAHVLFQDDEIRRVYEIRFFDDETCAECIYFDGDTGCNSEFECGGLAQECNLVKCDGIKQTWKKGEYVEFRSKHAWKLDARGNPVLLKKQDDHHD